MESDLLYPLGYSFNAWFQHQWCEVAVHVNETPPTAALAGGAIFQEDLPNQWQFEVANQAPPTDSYSGRWNQGQFSGTQLVRCKVHL